jgi:hypothetical protein
MIGLFKVPNIRCSIGIGVVSYMSADMGVTVRLLVIVVVWDEEEESIKTRGFSNVTVYRCTSCCRSWFKMWRFFSDRRMPPLRGNGTSCNLLDIRFCLLVLS